jgi:Tol biopolymer transport system component/serine/threonine protein kinase
MSLAPGTRIGTYEVVEMLGAGGMGEVYRARDTRLDRTVALKALPGDKLVDEERKRRFVQEARTASALNHPNIVTIHGLETAGDADFLVMEYVDGETLDRVVPKAGLPLKQALRYAIQIADALSAAHTAGIVHRDLKPANVIVTPTGAVKLLDFGIVKLREPAAVDATAFTVTSEAPPPTAAGTILGTAPYMSPEQVEGRAIDARSDIFSFGAVLYEMLAGQRAFQGESSISTLSAVLRDDPKPLSQIIETMPRDLEKLVTRCLRKEPGRRYQHMDDLKVILEELKEELESGSRQVGANPLEAPGGRWTKPRTAIIGALALVIAGTLVWIVLRPSSPAPNLEARLVPLTTFPGIEQQPAVSPDGQLVAFSWNGAQRDNFDIYVQHVEGGAPLRLTTHPADDISPAWSPDGGRIAFVRQTPGQGAVILLPSLGGPERRLIEVAFHAFMDRRLDWSPDGKLLAIADPAPPKECEISVLSIETGEMRVLVSPPAGAICDNSPAFSPDGRSVGFVRWAGLAAGEVYVIATAGGEAKRLTFDNRQNRGPVWTPDGRDIVFSSERDGRQALWRIAATGGTPEKITDAQGSYVVPGVSRQTTSGSFRVALEETVLDSNIWRVKADDRSDSVPSPLIASSRQDAWPRYAPDGKKIAFASDRSGNWEIWISDEAGAQATPLTSFRGGLVGSPAWSPDSRRIAFDARPEGNPDIFTVSAEGGRPRRLTTDLSEDAAPSWSQDGRWIYFASDRDGSQQVWKTLADGAGAPLRVTERGGFSSQESPDGRFLYYTKRRFLLGGLWRIPADGGTETRVLDQLDPEYDRMWALTSKGLFFVRGERPARGLLSFLPFSAHGPMSVAVLDNLDRSAPGLSVSPDGRWILYPRVDQRNTDILLLENLRPR